MIQVQSTWFPLVDRNPQQFMNVFDANESDFLRATHKVFGSSSISLLKLSK
jgi:predicted acyl esterase